MSGRVIQTSRKSDGNIYRIFHGKLLSTGVVSSPDFPSNYPDSLARTERVEVEQGMVLSLEFTAFDIESNSDCDYDHLTITDGNGATLMEKSCGSAGNLVIGGEKRNSTLPPNIWSWSNKVNFVFVTDGGGTRPGWSVSWSAVTPGECPFFV